MYSRLQTRLNPVPESLNSPDIAPPSSANLIRARDDPVRVYNRELAVSSSTVSTTSSSRSTEPASTITTSKLSQQQQQQHLQQQQQQKQKLQKQLSNNGYNSSSSDGENQNRPTAPTAATKTTSVTSCSTPAKLKPKTSNVAMSSMMSTSMVVESKVDSGKVRPSSASRSTSLGRKGLPANKQVSSNPIRDLGR